MTMRGSRLPLALVALLLLGGAADAAARSMTAGDIDDHLNWDDYLDYLERFGQDRGDLPGLSLGDRATLQLHDADGDPLGHADVQLRTDAGQVRLRSGMDGLVRVFPVHDGLGPAGGTNATVTAPDGTTRSFQVDLRQPHHTMTVATNATAATALDLMFLIDTTGSMGDELDYLTRELEHIVANITSHHPDVDIRYGLVLYRDTADEYVTRDLGFTDDLQTMQAWLADQQATGGGDYPEAMHAGLDKAVNSQWRDEAVRMIVLAADAPPHARHYVDFLRSARDARVEGIHIHPLAASGVADEAEYLMRAAAALTQGRYMFLTDDSGIGGSHAEPTIACYVVTTLGDLLSRVVASELAGTRVEPDPAAVVRTSGHYEMGVCLDDPEAQQGTQSATEGDGGSSASGGEAPTSPTKPPSGDSAGTVSSDTTDLRYHGDYDAGDSLPTEPTEPTDTPGAPAEPSDDQATPGPAVPALLAVLGLVAVALRRRS